MTLVHHFNVQVAQELGVHAAIIAANVQFWCAKNEANESERHFHDGKYWTFNSVTALERLFPYLTSDQIRYALKKCVADDLLLAGNFNSEKRDRTKWYAYNGAEWFKKRSELHLGNLPNGICNDSEMTFGKIPKPLPDTNPDNKPDSSAHIRARVNEKLIPLCANYVAKNALSVLLREMSAFDGRRVLVCHPFYFDQINNDLRRELRSAGLKLVSDPVDILTANGG